MQSIDTKLASVRFEFIRNASGHFLMELIPYEWEDMSEEEQNIYLEEYAFEPLEYASADYIWNLIETAGESAFALHLRLI